MDLDPKSAEAHFGYAHLLSNSGRHERALQEIKLSRELDPLSLVTNALEGQILFFARRDDEALERLQKAIDLEPKFWLAYLFISRVFTEKGMHPEAVAAAKKAADLSGNSQSQAYRAYALARWGKFSDARDVLNQLLQLSTGTCVGSKAEEARLWHDHVEAGRCISLSFAQKVSAQMSSRYGLCVLCDSVVVFSASFFTTETQRDTEVAQRKRVP